MLNRYAYLGLLLPFLGWSCAQTSGQTPRTQPATSGQRVDSAAATLAPDAADYPPYDAEIFRLLTEGLARKATTARLAQYPDDPEIIRDLLRQERVDEALVVLRRMVDVFPERMPRAFEAMYGQGARFRSQAHGHPQALQEIVVAAKQQLARLPREDAARVARQLLLVDRQPTCPGENRTANFLRCFLADYAGTETALLTQVDLIEFQGGPLSDRLAALDQLIREHPGTVVAAKALSQKAFQLSSSNVYAGRPPFESRDADPTPRLLQMLDIVGELESGRYPPCEWVSGARRWGAGFFDEHARFSPESIDRLIEAYRRFVVTHFTLDPLFPARYGIGRIIATTIPRLLERKGNPDVEPMLDRLEREVSDPAAARYLRAAIYIESLNGEHPVDRSAAYQKAVAALLALHHEGDAAINRRALATLASLYFSERDYTRARDAFRDYLTRYPRTTWAWVAAFRLGESHEALGDWLAAADAYSAAATTYTTVPFARVLGHAYAAAIWRREDRFDRALIEQRNALAGWDPDFGVTYSVYESHPRRAEEDPRASPIKFVVRRDLADETDRLERSLKRPAGALVERGRRLIEKGSFQEASALAKNVRAQTSSPEVLSEARYWDHRARLGIALQLAAAENPRRNAREALSELEDVAKDSYDFGVFMAEIATASVLWQMAAPGDAESVMRAAIERWEASQREARERPRSDLARDVAAIRELIVQPQGGSMVGEFVRNTLGRQRTIPQLPVVDPDVQVRLSDGTVRRVTVYQQFSRAEHVLFLTGEQRAAFGGIVAALDGRQNQSRTGPGAGAPNAGDRRPPVVRPLWDRFFPTTEWGQTPGQTAPSIIDIEFLNTDRTQAAARIQAASQGATVMLHKVGGIWSAIELVDSWIA